MKAPDFWQRGQGGLTAALLSPFGWLYGIGGQMNEASATPVRAPIPVICIGNVVAGGAGKTPVAIDLGQRLLKAGVKFEYLSRGYGGSEQGPHRIDLTSDTAAQVGDEPLLLARVAPTWIAKDRVQGGIAIVDGGAKAIVMDDGLQNPSLFKDASFVVIDGRYGLGNGHVMPAGPLRETLESALEKGTAVIVMGDDEAGVTDAVKQHAPEMQILNARVKARAVDYELKNQPVHAFAGIAQPEKFFETLNRLDCTLIKTTPFADHHLYTDAEISQLVTAAETDKALLLTTEKDYVRLDKKWQNAIKPLGIALEWQDEDALNAILEPLIEWAS